MTRADIVRNIINDDGYYYTKHSVLEIVNVIFDEHEAQLKAKDEEIERLKAIAEEAIKKPMGVQPHSWSDYKMKDNK